MNNPTSQHHESPPRWLFLLIALVVALGTILTWWGTRGNRSFHFGPRAEVILSGRVPVSKLSSSSSQALTEGQQLNTTYCAGCHEKRERLIGPSYELVAANYRGIQDRSHMDALSLLAEGISHPRPGWDDYPPGPSHPVLTIGERTTLAYWILNDDPGASAVGKPTPSDHHE